MFESLQGSARVSVGRRFLMLLLSAVLHALMLLLLVLLPLMFFRILPGGELLTFLIAAPELPHTPVPPVPQLEEPERAAAREVPVAGTDFILPEEIPIGVPAPRNEPPPTGVVDRVGISGLGAFTPSGGPAGLPGAVIGIKPEPPLPPPPPPVRPAPLRVGGDVQQAKLLRKAAPEYPEIARKARASGSVFLEVMVDEEGNVADVRVVQGNPLLTDAAIRAVKQWKYSPTLLNGEPVRVVALVTVIFSLK